LALLPFVFTGQSRREVGRRAGDLRRRLREDARDPAQLAAELMATATAGPYRAVVLSRGGNDLREKLGALAAERRAPEVVEGKARDSPRVAFVFPPLRSEYPAMGMDLPFFHSPFRRQMQTCETTLSRFVEWSLEDVLDGKPGTPPFNRLDVSQPVLFAVSVALAELWCSCGVEPDAVLGHSVGEIAAAVSCGALTLAEAGRVATTWGRSSMRLEGTGEMISLPLSAAATEKRISPWAGRLSLAALNAPSWTAVAGDDRATEELLETLAEDGVHGRAMGIGAPGHSPLMAPVHDWFTADLGRLSPRTGTAPFYSAVAGDRAEPTGLTADYWSANLQRPVRFEAAVRALLRDGYDIFVEVGPRPVLTAALEEVIGGGNAIAIRTLEQGERASFLTSLAQAFALGVEVSWPQTWATGPAPPRAAEALVPEGEALLELVLAEAAAMRGKGPPTPIDPDRPFKDLGFDSAAAVDLRNALNRRFDLTLPATLAFDHPTPRDVARKVRVELEGGGSGERTPPLPSEIDDLDLTALVDLTLRDGG